MPYADNPATKGDSVARKPLGLNDMSQEDIGTTLGRYRTAENFYRARGRTAPNFIRNRINRLSTHYGEGSDQFGGVDFGDPNFDQSQASGVLGILDQAAGRHIRPGQYGKQLDTLRAQAQAKGATEYESSQIEPLYQQASQSASEMAANPTYGAGYIANARSQLAAQLRGAKEQELRTVNSILGIRGMDPSSPAGASILEKASMDADAELAQALQGLDQGITGANRQGQMQATITLQQLASARSAAHRAAVTGDYERLYQINDSLQALMEAIRTTQEERQYANAQMRDASGRDWLGMGVAFAGNGISGMAQSGLFNRPQPSAYNGPPGLNYGGLQGQAGSAALWNEIPLGF